MKKQNGFTLIELLVVVLIIGILAAVALPQYMTAVEKSRASEAFINLKAILNAQRGYMLETGTTASAPSWDSLSIDIPGNVLGPSGISARTKQGTTFQYSIGDATGNYGHINSALRIPARTTYGIMTTDKAWYCCWWSAQYQKICASLGFNTPDDAMFTGATCNNNSK